MKVLLPHGWDAPVGYANGIAAGSGTLIFVADLLDHPAKIEFEATAVA